jgi:hypothetical protein
MKKAERSMETTNLLAPIHSHVWHPLVSGVSDTLSLVLTAQLSWRALVGHTDLRVRRRSAAVISSQSSWQQDQHGCNQRGMFSCQCYNRLARKGSYSRMPAAGRSSHCRCLDPPDSREYFDQSGRHGLFGSLGAGCAGLRPLVPPQRKREIKPKKS